MVELHSLVKVNRRALCTGCNHTYRLDFILSFMFVLIDQNKVTWPIALCKVYWHRGGLLQAIFHRRSGYRFFGIFLRTRGLGGSGFRESRKSIANRLDKLCFGIFGDINGSCLLNFLFRSCRWEVDSSGTLERY
jgi:hypothetical protein